MSKGDVPADLPAKPEEEDESNSIFSSSATWGSSLSGSKHISGDTRRKQALGVAGKGGVKPPSQTLLSFRSDAYQRQEELYQQWTHTIGTWLSTSVCPGTRACHIHVLQTMGPRVLHPPHPEATHGTEQRYHVHVLVLAARVRETKERLYRETQRQESISTGLERTRRCTGKVQDHSNAAGLEVLCKKPWMRPSDPTGVPWDMSLTWSLGKMMVWGPPRPPRSGRVAMGGERRAAGGSGLPSPPSPSRLRASCSCCRFAGLPPSQAAVVYVIAGRFTFYHLIK